MDFSQHHHLLKIAVLEQDDALDFLLKMGKVFRVWDNLWDQDKEVTPQDADEALTNVTFELSRNPFFVRYRDVLECQIFLSWNAWKDANEWEGSIDPYKKRCAWIIRDYCNELVQLCAWLIGGKDHVRKVSLLIREAYLKELIEGDSNGTLQLNNDYVN